MEEIGRPRERVEAVRPELDRIGELVITEAGNSAGRGSSPAGFHLIPSWLTTDSVSLSHLPFSSSISLSLL